MTSRSDGTNVTAYGWDQDNRLMLVTLPDASTVAYTYDAAGRMLSRTGSSGATTFVWDGANCILETDASGVVTHYYTPQSTTMMGFDRTVGDTSTRYQVHPDALGSGRKVTDPAGAVLATFDSDVWGNSLSSSTDSVPNGGLMYRFIGGYSVRFDPSTQLYYMVNRWMDPILARFISRDAVGSRSYRYANNNPLIFVDPTGYASVRLNQLIGDLFHLYLLPDIAQLALDILRDEGVLDKVPGIKIMALQQGPDLYEIISKAGLELKKLGPNGYRKATRQILRWIKEYDLTGCTIQYYQIGKLLEFDKEAAAKELANLIKAGLKHQGKLGIILGVGLLGIAGSAAADASELSMSGNYGSHPFRGFLFPHAEELLKLNAGGADISLSDVLNALTIDLTTYYGPMWWVEPIVEFIGTSNTCYHDPYRGMDLTPRSPSQQ